MFFYDLHAHSEKSIGEDSENTMLEMAARLDLAGLGLARYYTPEISFEWPKNKDIDVVKVIIIKPKTPEELVKLAAKVREKTEILMVHGGDYKINRKACETSMIDVLCHPELGRKDSGLDHICVKEARDNNVAIEVNFREILESYKRNRVYVISAIQKNINLCKKYGTKVVATSGSVSKWGLRNGRQLASICHMLGMELTDAVASTTTIPEQIVQVNRKKLENKKWEGVEINE